MDGILNINKPQGKTSFGTVAVVRRLTAERRVGHAGTLDPLATGVLPVCLGQGTRITEFLVDATKVYHAQIELGRATDTYDTSGQTTQQGDPSGISREKLESALNSFRGLIQQTPPMYSALKHHGKRLYQLARAGIQVARPSRPARIEHLELIDFNPPLVTIEIACGKGTYIRSIAHDLGQILGCGANLKSLVRLRSGHFDIKDAVSLDELENACRHGYWQNYLYPIDVVLLDWAAVIVSEAQGKLVSRGQSLVLEKLANSQKAERANPSFQSHCRAYTLDGLFLGVLRFNPKSGEWQPRKVLCQLE